MAMGMSMKSKFAVATKIVAADGSGDFDDIQSAINDLPSGGGVVYIKEGTYTLTSAITITSNNINLTGAGASTIIIRDTSYDISLIEIGEGTNTYTKITIKDLLLDGAETIIGKHGIHIRKSTNGFISNCIIKNTYQRGIYSDANSDSWRIANNDVDNCYPNIELDSDLNVVSDNITQNSDSDGILITGDKNTITGNTVDSEDNIGISLSGANNNIVANNIVNNSGGDANIWIGLASDNNTISGNRCLNGGYGIEVNGGTSNKNMLHGNMLLGNTTAISNSGTSTADRDNTKT